MTAVSTVTEEPTEFGSIVLARLNDASWTTRVRWVCLPAGWQSEDGEHECPYHWLRDVEVLRVGIGEAAVPCLAPKVDREALWEAIVKVRDASPRVPDDADTEDIVDAVLALLNPPPA